MTISNGQPDISAMITQLDLAEAKAKLSESLDRALAGEEIVIAQAGKSLVRLTPLKPKRLRKPGAWRDRGASIPTDVLLPPMDPQDIDAAEAKYADDLVRAAIVAESRDKRK